jgi:predicted RND superfamily exporter protein
MILPAIDAFADAELEEFQIQIFVHNLSYGGLVGVLDRLVSEARYDAGPGVQVSASGSLASNIRLVRQSVRGQVHSLLVLLASATLMLMVIARSLRTGLLLALPMVLAIGGSFFAMVQIGLPYGIAVSMFPALVVGLSVDFSIHLHAALTRNSLRNDGWRKEQSEEIAIVLRGILWNGILWSAGFALLTVSNLPPNRYLGLLSALVIALSTLLTVGLLPAFVAAVQRRSHNGS